jgi:broad specificity phosphatase PhoE
LVSKKIYLIRHGQTDYNKQGIVQGSGIDASLNEEGRRQAEAFYKAYKHINFDKIYISTLRRTQETVQLFIDSGAAYEKLPGLNEIGWGVAEGTIYLGENINPFFDIIHRWRAGEVDLKVEGGESPFDVQLRQQDAMEHILSRTEEKTILICMHGRAIRILLCWIQGHSLCDMDNFTHDNLCLYEISYNGRNFFVETYNDIRHLQQSFDM